MIASIVGIIGIGANIIIYQQKSGKKLLLFKLISDFLWALHYILFSANSAAIIATINIFREFVFFSKEKRWAKSKLWLVFFLFCSIISAIFTYKSLYNILPAIASILSVISFWRSNPNTSRIFAYPISISMLTYDIFCLSYMGIINEILTLLSTTIGILHYKKEK